NELIAQGLQFTVATARSIHSVTTVIAGLQLKLPIIEFNGAFITDFYTGEHLLINEIDKSITREIYELAVSAGIAPFISTFDGKVDRLYYNHPDNEGMDWYLQNRLQAKDPRLCFLDKPTPALKEQVVSLTMIGEKRPLTTLNNKFHATFSGQIDTHFYENPYSPDWYWLTIHEPRARKNVAIQSLIELMGLQPAEIVAFGDQSNDLTMLQAADRGIAMDNAIPQLKEVADQTIGANMEDSVVHFIERDWKK
ncbi:MAG: HAD-IIB family hydrolase, partial [Chloroflexi bacterium]|nr:HAD-IIB family hydrolase [Chloroflexota bacterium]